MTLNHNSFYSSAYSDDRIDTVAVFGEVKRSVISKRFMGGEVHNFFASTEIDLSNADMSGVVVLDVAQLFGETKLIVPAGWRIETDFTHIFAASDDKRRELNRFTDGTKVLVITGISLFASVKIIDAYNIK